MGSVTNIISSFAQVYSAPKGTELPRVLFGWPTGWTNLGYTFGGVQLTYLTESVYHKVDQESSPVLYRLKDKKARIRSAIAEVTIPNLKQLIPCSDITEPTAQGLGLGGNKALEYMLGVEGIGVDGNFRAYIFHNVGPALVGLPHEHGSMNLAAVEWGAIGDIDILEGGYIVTTPGVDLLKVYRWTASGLMAVFDIPAKIISGSDPQVIVNGVIQDPGVSYTVSAYSSYTRITFTELPTAGDVILVYYQVRT